ncbi:MAG: sigma 54-interacting transcriptional regulator, partial [Planctomycetales bacterium]
MVRFSFHETRAKRRRRNYPITQMRQGGRGVHIYVTMTAGDQAGESILLTSEEENTFGRGPECRIVLNDPACSRIHAMILCEEGHWVLRDNRRRNGTFVNGQKIDEAVLYDNCFFRVGKTEFSFHQNAELPLDVQPPPTQSPLTQTLVVDKDVNDGSVPIALGALENTPQVRELLLLYQLSIRQLAVSEADEVLRISLDVLQEQTQASLVGFLWVTDDGELKPKMILPEGADDQISLSRTLTQKVVAEQRAIWVSNHSGGITESLQHFSDALCVPLVFVDRLLGVLHVYTRKGSFTQRDFEFTVSLGRVTAAALARAFREQSLQADVQRLKQKSAGFDELIGECPAMLELKRQITRVGPTHLSALILGESGTGKELVARGLHRHGKRADRPLLSVNCAAIPDSLMDSQLFGHKKGAFTGANEDHLGYFQQADGGTLFLDEAGELTPEGQAKLLRIMEGHAFLPVGAMQEIQVDVRVITATNKDLENDEGFREDLYYRFGRSILRIPPLRERGE